MTIAPACYFCNELMTMDSGENGPLKYEWLCDKHHELDNLIPWDNSVHLILWDNHKTVFFRVEHIDKWYEFRLDFIANESKIHWYPPYALDNVLVSIPAIANWTPQNARSKLKTFLTFS